MSKNAKLVGCGMGMGFAPTWLRQVSPLASRDHLNHWVLCNVLLKYIYWRYSYSRSFSSEFRLHKVTGGYDLDFVKRDWNRSRDRRIEHSFKNGPKHYDNDKKTGAKPYFKPKSSISRTLLIALLRVLTVHQLIFLERISAHSFAGIERPIACQ